MTIPLPVQIDTWQMTEPGKLARTSLPVPQLNDDEALVEVRGCGVCHTDISFFYHGIPTEQKPPLTLGHEISGVVVAGPPRLLGCEVLVPAVMPCNQCEICRSGRSNRCLAQKMPGNSLGIYGGFSSHIPVPAADLCVIGDRKGMRLEDLCVVADAVTTPYYAVLRARIQEGDRVVVVGATGALGIFVTQIAKLMGATTVIGIGRNQDKLKLIERYGADFTINAGGKDAKAVREAVKSYAKARNIPSNWGWKIFEVTGVKSGQEIALALLSFVGTLVVVGYGTGKSEFMLSKLMAYEADIVGAWGCPPKYYPEALRLCLERKIALEPFVETRPMSRIADVFDEALNGRFLGRAILTPDF